MDTKTETEADTDAETEIEKPFYIGFGSMPSSNTRLSHIVLEAVRKTGIRAVILKGVLAVSLCLCL